MKPVRVGLLGIGTVGSGVFTVLSRNAAEIARRAGRSIELVAVADLDIERAQKIVGAGVKVVGDAQQLIDDASIDVVIELIGGYGIAKKLVLAAIAAGKHVVTANKALLAVHGSEIFAAAEAKGVIVAFEASVAGGIPIIKALDAVAHEIGACTLHQMNKGQLVLQRDLLHAQHLVQAFFLDGSRLDARVAGHDHAAHAADKADARQHAAAGHGFFRVCPVLQIACQ